MDLNWLALNLPTVDLSSLDSPFTEEEILRAITQTPKNKALGSDGFTGLFFKQYRETIKSDLIAVINSFHNSRCADLNLLNKANLILIAKRIERRTFKISDQLA